jgi:hypothetical protein
MVTKQVSDLATAMQHMTQHMTHQTLDSIEHVATKHLAGGFSPTV